MSINMTKNLLGLISVSSGLFRLQAVKYPALAFRFLQPLLGKEMDDPAVKDYQQRFPFYNLERDYTTGGPIFTLEECVQGLGGRLRLGNVQLCVAKHGLLIRS